MKIKYFVITAVLVTAILCSGGAIKAQSATSCMSYSNVSDQITCFTNLITQLTQSLAQLQNQQGATPTPTPTAFCHTFITNLGYANSGTVEVGYLHTALQKEGILYGTDTANEYTKETLSAIIKFQKKYGILQTGYVGPITRAKLNTMYRCGTNICTPNWKCNLGICTNGYQSQVPVDSNNCGVTTGKINCTAQAQACTPPTSSPSITVTSPNGGEIYKIGDKMVVKWNSNNFPVNATVSVQLYQRIIEPISDQNPSGIGHYGIANIADNIPNNGSFEWIIPTSLSESNRYEISIQGPNNAEEGKGTIDFSDGLFSILGGHPIIVNVLPTTVQVGGVVHVTVDAKDSGVADQVKSVIVSLESLDSSSHIPSNFTYSLDTLGRWSSYYTIPISAKVGTWVVRQVGLFNNSGVIKYFNYPHDINNTFTVVSSATPYVSTQPSINLTIDPDASGPLPPTPGYVSVPAGSNVAFNWTVQNADSCFGGLDTNSMVSEPLIGSFQSSNLHVPITFKLTCEKDATSVSLYAGATISAVTP